MIYYSVWNRLYKVLKASGDYPKLYRRKNEGKYQLYVDLGHKDDDEYVYGVIVNGPYEFYKNEFPGAKHPDGGQFVVDMIPAGHDEKWGDLFTQVTYNLVDFKDKAFGLKLIADINAAYTYLTENPEWYKEEPLPTYKELMEMLKRERN